MNELLVNDSRLNILNITVLMRYILSTVVVVVINMIVFMISPGNLVMAIMFSSVSIMALVPSGSAESDSSADKEDSLTFERISSSLDDQEMSVEENRMHKTLGTIFDVMAISSGQDLYSSDITGTESVPKKEEKAMENNQQVKVRLEVSNDGLLHYIFEEEEKAPAEEEKLPVNIQENTRRDTTNGQFKPLVIEEEITPNNQADMKEA